MPRCAASVAPALAAVLAMACGRSLTLDDRPGSGGAGGSSTPNDAGDTGSAGGTSGAAGAGSVGGSSGTGGTKMPPIDAGNDRPRDASPDVADTRAPDLAPDRTSTPDVGGCPVDCTQLPHVLPGVPVSCVNGVCNLSYGHCEPGFAHCSATPNVGCESDLSASPNCGICGLQCGVGYGCSGTGAGSFCVQDCAPPTPDRCDVVLCVDLQTDVDHCGACGNSCYLPNTLYSCQQGQCATLGCSDSTVADCTSDPGCETVLGNDPNCGGCNDPACTLANTMYTCSDGLGCTASVCEVGFANCDTSSPDCETEVGSTTPTSGGCLPQYVGSVGLATQVLLFTATAIAPDGSFFIGGTYQGTVDFDPSSPGKDIRTANDPDGFITKFNADGTYAWTAALAGRGALSLQALAVTPAGGVVATGAYTDTIDLDPSAGQDIHVTNDIYSNDVYVVEIAASGSETWGRTFASTAFDSISASNGIAVDAAGAVYVVGSFSGTVDFDPGAGSDAHDSPPNESIAFLVKLTSNGDRAWSRIIDDQACMSSLQAVTVASDGSAWATGMVSPVDGMCALTQGQYSGALIIRVNTTGDTRTTWAFANSQSQGGAGMAIAAGRDGAVYVGGSGSGDVDMDPGPAVARRWLGPLFSGSGFVLKLAADGTYQWSRVLSTSPISAMAPAPDGGVIAAGSATTRFVTRLTASGASVWTIPFGDGLNQQVSLTSINSNATSFVVGGTSSGTQDFDPSPAVDLLFGDIAFVSRFSF